MKMLKKALCSSLATMSLIGGVSANMGGKPDFEEIYDKKIFEFIQNSDLELSISDVFLYKPKPVKVAKPVEGKVKQAPTPEPTVEKPKDPFFKVRVSACKLEKHSKHRFATWKELRQNIRAYRDMLKDGRRYHINPIIREITVSVEECAHVDAIKGLKSELAKKRVLISIPELMAQAKKPMNINDAGTYLKMTVTEGAISTSKKTFAQRIRTYDLLNDLILEKPVYSLNLTSEAGHRVGVDLSLRYKGANVYPKKDLVNKPIKESILLIDSLSQDEELKRLFFADAGVYERYSIKEHSLRVMILLEMQYTCLTTQELEKKFLSRYKMPLKNFMQLTMALHDIGKPDAVAAGNKDRQHEFTRPILEDTLLSLGVNKEAVTLAGELMDNDILGDLLKSTITPKEAYDLLVLQAQKVNLEPQEFLAYQRIFYTTDAGSYPSLHNMVFKMDKKTGCMEPASNRYRKMEYLIDPSLEEKDKQEKDKAKEPKKP